MSDIYELVTTEKATYESGTGVPVAGAWNWSMYNHINYSLLMKNGQFPLTQTKMGERPQKNIILPILNVAYRSEGFDVKDIEPYVNEEKNHYKSLLVRKFHPRWARKNDIDTFIDEVVESYVDYGGVLVKNVNAERPEVVQWQQIAFCDQTDILSGTIALKHQYTIDQLKDMEKQGWYKDKIDLAINAARAEKENDQAPGQVAKTPNKHIEVFEVHGTFPETWLEKENDQEYNDELDGDKYSPQIHIITYIKGTNDDTNTGICLYKGKEPKPIFKFLSRDKIFNRALGRGGVEELFEPQIWTNNTIIHMQELLEHASKIIYQTADQTFGTRNNTTSVKMGAVWIHDDGKPATQVKNQPFNFNLFDRATAEWEQHARTTGSASDPSLGLNPVSGTPLGTTQIVTAQGIGIHEYRRGKIATFIAEIYRDWVLDYLVSELNKGDKWLDSLTPDEMVWVADRVVENDIAKRLAPAILAKEVVDQQQVDDLRAMLKDSFMKSGNKKFLEVVKNDLKSLPIDVEINIANKQKDLGRMADKLSNVFRVIFANPQGFVSTMQIPGAAKAFSEMMEASGLSSFDYSQMPAQSNLPQPTAQEPQLLTT
jgi:hypothetical protein